MSLGAIFAGAIGQTELIISCIILLLLEARKSGIMRGLGKGVKSLKTVWLEKIMKKFPIQEVKRINPRNLIFQVMFLLPDILPDK
jgi:hypothetical protein